MELLCKRVDKTDIENLVLLRTEFIEELHPEYTQHHIELIRKSVRSFFVSNINSNTYYGYLGFLPDGSIVNSGGLLTYILPPLQFPKSRRVGHLLNFYTRPNHRRKGYGKQLLNYIVDNARGSGLYRITLNSTEMGYSLYEKTGFRIPADRNMTMEL